MYSVRNKIGDIIAVWGDADGLGSVSTTAAMLAARLGLEGKINKKVLMLSTDRGPYDGVSILNPVAQDEYTMDNLILLTAAGGLKSEEGFLSYAIKVSKNVDVMHSSNDFKRLSSDSVWAYRKILDYAATIYDYVVVDVGGKVSAMTEMIVSHADLVLICLSQHMKHLETVREHSLFTGHPALEEKDAAVVLTRYAELPYLDVKQVGKLVSCNAILTLSEDVAIHQSVCQCSVMDFVQALYKQRGGLSGLRKKRGSEITAAELDELARIVYSLHAVKNDKSENEGGI